MSRTPEQKAKHAAIERKRRLNPAVRERGRQLCKQNYLANRQDRIIEASENRRKLRKELIMAYGGKCECCNIDTYEFLNLDHIFGGGIQDRENSDRYDIFRRLKREGWPKDKYRLLCFNCNISLGDFGYCPHQIKESRYDNSTDSRHKLKLEMISAYGGKCECCMIANPEFLTLDHKYGDGRIEREASGHTFNILWALKRAGWPKERHRILCFNCNCVLANYVVCPHIQSE